MSDLTSALAGSLLDYRMPTGSDLLGRLQPFADWSEVRRQQGFWPYSRSLQAAPKPNTPIRDDRGRPQQGINFASQDYLSLASHPAIKQAAIEAIETYGVHSAGSASLVGNTAVSLALEAKLAKVLHCKEVLLFPTGWAAGFGLIQGIIRPKDHVVMDALAHACLQGGAAASTANVHSFRHNDVNHLEKKLRDIRNTDAENGILVVTEGLFSMDSDTPDIAEIQALCHRFNAILMVDIAHDFGSMGPNGTGALGEQNMLGKVDIVMGSFSKTFASNGGFVASNHPALKIFLKCYSNPQTFSNALSPVQAAVISKALSIVLSAEGDMRRANLVKAANALRREMANHGFSCLGRTSPIVPVTIGNEALIRLAADPLAQSGILANMVEYPAVRKGKSRFRFQVMSDHTQSDAETAASALAAAVKNAEERLAILMPPQMTKAA